MNRVPLFRHPLHALRVSNPKLPLPFFQSHTYTPTPTRMDSELLNNKKCVPCNSKDLRPMTHDAAHSLIQQVAQWNLVNEGDMLKLRRSWKVKTFTKGLEFFRRIADLAEAEGHHPDLHLVGWNNITIEIWTHAVGGLTENDFILAAKINELNLHDLLRRSV